MMKEIFVSVQISLLTIIKQMTLCIKAAKDPKNVGWCPHNRVSSQCTTECLEPGSLKVRGGHGSHL